MLLRVVMREKFLVTRCTERWARKGLVGEMAFGVKKS